MPVVPVARSAWRLRRTARPKGKIGAVTAKKLLHPFHKVLACPTAHAERLLDLPTVNAPVAGSKSNHLLAFSRPSVRTHLTARMEFEGSAETEAGGEATASQMVQMIHRLVQALMQILVHAAKSVLIQLVPQKENNAVASAGRRHHCCQKVLVSLMVLVLELQTALMKTPLVPAATQNMFHHATKQRNARRPLLKLV